MPKFLGHHAGSQFFSQSPMADEFVKIGLMNSENEINKFECDKVND